MPGTAVVDFWLSGWDSAPTTTTYSVPTATLVLRADAPALTLTEIAVQRGGLVELPVRYLVQTARRRLYADSPRLRVSEVTQPDIGSEFRNLATRPRARPVRRTTLTATSAQLTLHADAPTIKTTPLREREEEDALVLLGIL